MQTARNIKLQGAISGDTNFDGSGNITINTVQSNRIVLTGDISSDGTDAKISKTIQYPQGFNQNNTFVISVMLELENSSVIWGYGATFNSASYVSGSIPCRVSLRANDMAIEIRHIYMVANDNKVIDMIADSLPKSTWHYKILLEKQ